MPRDKTGREAASRPVILRRREESAPADLGEADWARGLRGPADLIAPDYVKVHPGYLQLGRTYCTVLHISALDPETGIGFLEKLVSGTQPVDLAWYVDPLPKKQAMDRLTRGATTAGAETRTSEDRLVDPAALRGAADMDALRHLVDAGEQKVWKAGFYILVRGNSLKELNRAMDTVYTNLGSGAHARVCYELMWHGLDSFTPLGQNLLGLHLWTDTDTVCRSWPLASTSLRRPEGIFWGFDYDTRSLVIFSPFDRSIVANSNVVTCGPSGRGKSFFVKVQLILRQLQEGVRSIVTDPKGEYRWVCECLGPEVAEYISLSPSATRGLSLFALSAGDSSQAEEEEVRYPVARKVASIRALIGQMLRGLSPEQEGLLDAALFTLYRQVAGLTRESTLIPAKATFPRLYQLVELLKQDPATLTMAQALQKYARGGTLSGIYDPEPENAILFGQKRLTVFDIHALTNEDDRAVASLLISDCVMSAIAGAQGLIRYSLVIDEAWRLMDGPGADNLGTLARVARSLGLMVVFISQLLEDFVGTREQPKPKGLAIFENSSFHVYTGGAIGDPEKLPASIGVRRDQIEFLRMAQKGEMLLEIEGRFFRLRTGPGSFSKTEYTIATSDPVEIARFRQEIGR